MAKKLSRLEDLTPDPQNANDGTVRGSSLLDRSLEQYGAGRGIEVDANGYVIAGNKTLEMAIARGLRIRVVPSDGTKLVVVKRTDLDLVKDPAARELAYADNRTSELGLSWNPMQIEADLANGLQLGSMFTQAEIDALLGTLEDLQRNTTLTFEDGEEWLHWLRFQRMLETRYAHLGPPSPETLGLQLDAWVSHQLAELAAEASGVIMNEEQDAETENA
jgi:hypothetical protein